MFNLPVGLGYSWGHSLKNFMEVIPGHPDISHIVKLGLPVQLLEQVVELAVDLASAYPWLNPPSSFLPVFFLLSPATTDSHDGHNKDILLLLVCQQQVLQVSKGQSLWCLR